jgi:primosomal protein N''
MNEATARAIIEEVKNTLSQVQNRLVEGSPHRYLIDRHLADLTAIQQWIMVTQLQVNHAR